MPMATKDTPLGSLVRPMWGHEFVPLTEWTHCTPWSSKTVEPHGKVVYADGRKEYIPLSQIVVKK